MERHTKAGGAGGIRRHGAWLLLSVSLALSLIAHYETWGHLVPGVWQGDVGMFGPGLLWWAAAFLATVICTFALGKMRRYVLMSIAPLFFFLPPFVLRQYSDVAERNRYNMEYHEYREAVASGKPYGDQHAESVDGRELVYWRWMAFGIDNAIGVIHDPERRLSLENNADRMAFREFTHGVLWTIKEVEPGWYFVTHS